MASATVRRRQLIADAESYPQRCGGPLGAHGKAQTVRRSCVVAVGGACTRTSASGCPTRRTPPWCVTNLALRLQIATDSHRAAGALVRCAAVLTLRCASLSAWGCSSLAEAPRNRRDVGRGARRARGGRAQVDAGQQRRHKKGSACVECACPRRVVLSVYVIYLV